MNIIKQGDELLANIRLCNTKEFHCPMCDCVFEANIHEYHLNSQYNRYWCNCPCCKNVVLYRSECGKGLLQKIKNIFKHQ